MPQVADPINLIVSYEELKSLPGLLTPAFDNQTISNLSHQRLAEIFQSLFFGSFHFAARMKRILLPKPKSSKKRPLTIPSPIDRIVHRSMASVLEQIYEPIFLPVSFGFRKWRNTHMLFHELQNWTGVRRVIRGDVSKCFDSVHHKLVLDLLAERIDDPFFL
ncbi:hypothetical protein SUGI_1225060 [Cryptomeria japonica]|uniref:Reverse transcriptase domain-containing protein n=1 Tax=Cryptomeria japonica TaxID=3369 RepID=A0AAD3NPX3_CRYJA|nr:hypothetical protein SUGI_1225060 [Cryptomeria japonica]